MESSENKTKANKEKRHVCALCGKKRNESLMKSFEEIQEVGHGGQRKIFRWSCEICPLSSRDYSDKNLSAEEINKEIHYLKLKKKSYDVPWPSQYQKRKKEEIQKKSIN